MLTWGEKWKSQTLVNASYYTNQQLTSSSSIYWALAEKTCYTHVQLKVYIANMSTTSTKKVVCICTSHPTLGASTHMTDPKISVSEPICDKHIAQHMLRSVPVSNAALKKRHSDTLTLHPSCLCLTLNCEKCCSANFQVNKKLKTPGTVFVYLGPARQNFLWQMPPTQICTSCN